MTGHGLDSLAKGTLMLGLNRRKQDMDVAHDDATQPLLYEISVRGRLSETQWTSWFDKLTVSTSKGESTLRGRAPDHAALYALLSRLRDLAVPLLSVRILDAEAQRQLYRMRRRNEIAVSATLVAVYLTLLGAMATITVLIAPIIDTALALALLGAALGGVAHAFSTWTGHKAWRWVTYLAWPGAAISFMIYTADAGLLPTALAIAILLALVAGGVLYLIDHLRRRGDDVKGSIVDWESLGVQDDAPSPDASGEEASDEGVPLRGA